MDLVGIVCFGGEIWDCMDNVWCTNGEWIETDGPGRKG